MRGEAITFHGREWQSFCASWMSSSYYYWKDPLHWHEGACLCFCLLPSVIYELHTILVTCDWPLRVSWLPVVLSSKQWPKVWPNHWTNHSQVAWVVLQPHNKGISRIKSSNRLAAYQTIPSAFWPTCYWEMTCFPKLHHEAEMINGLKSDKRICSGLLFPAYFNHVVMKWI